MFTRETAISIVKEFIKNCEVENIHFNKAILFGSTLNNTTNEDSDIDLLLVSDQFSYNKLENAKLLARINKQFSDIEAHTYPTEYFLKGDPFINQVMQTGIVIN